MVGLKGVPGGDPSAVYYYRIDFAGRFACPYGVEKENERKGTPSWYILRNYRYFVSIQG